MKKLFLGVMVFALIITSCNKYANDFQQLKDQIAALSLKVDGVAALQTQLTATTAQITALQAAVAGLPQAASITALQTALTTANTNIGAIQTQLNNLATTGATAASVAALKAQLDDAAAKKLITDAATAKSLADLQTALAGAATSADLAAARTAILDLITSTAVASSKASSDSIAAAKAAILTAIAAGSADVDAKIAALQEMVDAGNKANAAALAKAIADIASLSSTVAGNQEQTQASIAALNALAKIANTDLQILLAQSAMYNGDVYIETDFDVDFFFGKLNQLQIINGNVLVNTAGISAAKLTNTDVTKSNLNTILGKMIAVIGQNTTDVTTITKSEHKGTTVTITTALGSGHWVKVFNDITDPTFDMSQLISVRGSYTIDGADVNDVKIDNVGGDFVYNYPGDYVSNVTAVGGNLILVNQVLTTVAGRTGNISFPNVVVEKTHFVGAGTAGVATAPVSTTVVFNSAGTTSVNFGLATGAQINNLTANNATMIKLGTITPNGLLIHALTVNSTMIDLSAATSSTGPISVYTAPGIVATVQQSTMLDLSNLETSTGNILAALWDAVHPNAGVVKLDKFNSNVAVEIAGLTNVENLGSWKATAAPAMLTANQATTVTLPLYEWAVVPSITAVKWLWLGNIKHDVALNGMQTLVTAKINGAQPATNHWSALTYGVMSSGNANLEKIWLSGWMDQAALNASTLTGATGFEKLVEVHTATGSQINYFQLNSAKIITSLDLNHNAFVGDFGFGGPGSTLKVSWNPALTSLAPTALDWMAVLEVDGNDAMTSFDFSSYKTLIYTGPVSIKVSAKGDTGSSYVNGINTTGAGNPAIPAIIHSAHLLTLKPYLTALIAANTGVGATITALTYTLDVKVATGPVMLSTAMQANSTPFTPPYVNAVSNDLLGINTPAELGLLVN